MPMFPSKDLRTKKDVKPEQDVLKVVKVLSSFCRQGPGGQLDPHFLSSPLCILCSQGALCLGASCKGNQHSRKKQSVVRLESLETSLTIPGLSFLGNLANNPSKTAKRSQRLRKIKCFSPRSEIFNYQGIKPPNRQDLSSTKINTVEPRIRNNKSKVPPLKSVSNVVDKRTLQLFLINCGQKRKQRKKMSYSFSF